MTNRMTMSISPRRQVCNRVVVPEDQPAVNLILHVNDKDKTVRFPISITPNRVIIETKIQYGLPDHSLCLCLYKLKYKIPYELMDSSLFVIGIMHYRF